MKHLTLTLCTLALTGLLATPCGSSDNMGEPETGLEAAYGGSYEPGMPGPGPASTGRQSAPAAQSLAPPGGGPAPSGQQGGGVRVKRAEIIDRQGFGKPLVAGTIMIPAHWQAKGEVVWNPQNTCGGGYNYEWSAAAPDGSGGMALVPSMSWASNDVGMPNGCPVLQIWSVGDYLNWLVQTARPQARVLDMRPRPDLTKGLEGLNRVDPMPMGEIRSWVEAGEMLLGFTENGVEMRETVSTIVVFNMMRMQDGMGGVMEFRTGGALPGYAFYAPHGQLDFTLAEALRQSFRVGPEWNQRINQHHNKLAQINAKGARDRSQIIRQTNREISEMQRQSWEYSNATDDRLQRESTEAIRGTETYADPESPTGTSEFSNMYDNAFRMDDGTYVLTNDAFFNPSNGTKLEPLP